MSLFKFSDIGMLINSKNNPRVRAVSPMKNGYVFSITDGYTSGGSKSKVEITVSSDTLANGNIVFDIGGQTVYTTINATTQNTNALVAAEIKKSLDAVLLGLDYTVAVASAKITVTAPVNSASTDSVLIVNFDSGLTTVEFTNVYTAGTDAVSYAEAAEPFEDANAAKAGDVWVQMNIIDTPELLNQKDFVVTAGGYVNAYQLDNLVGKTIEMSSDLVIDVFTSVNVGDVLVPSVSTDITPMKWIKSANSGYSVALKVLEKTTFGGTGYFCKIISN